MGVIAIFIYPDNLTAKPVLWLWELKDLAVVGVGGLLSVLVLASSGFLLPLVLTVLYAFLSIRMEDASILDFLRNAVCFLFLHQQSYEWRERFEKKTEKRTKTAAVHTAAHGDRPVHRKRPEGGTQ